MLRMGLTLGCVGFLLALTSVAHAHSRWVDPPARSLADGLTTGPCGEVAPTGTPTELPAGATVDLQWIITQPHGGSFRVALGSSDDLGFDDAVLLELPEDGLPQDVTQSVELPACTCESCTLQLLQLTASGNGGYYSCADIRLTADPGDGYPPCETAVGTSGGSDGGDSSGGGGGSSTSGSTATTSGDDGESGTPGGDGGSSGGVTTDASSDGGGIPSDDDAGGGGCACTTTPTQRWGGAWALAVLAMVRRRRPVRS